jgi:predicted nucleic acid-binding protein
MKYVLDSSVAFKWVVAEDLTDKAQQPRDDFENATHELIAPDIFEVEIAHALTRAERQGRITVPQAGLLWADVMSTPPQLKPFGTLLPRAIDISSAMRIGVYDCLYVALAERDGCQVVTADEKLVKSLQPAFSFVLSLASLP